MKSFFSIKEIIPSSKAAVLCCLLLLLLIYPAKAQQQRVYDSLQLQVLTYSDVQRIYTSDSSAARLPFFQSPTIQQVQVSLKSVLMEIPVNNTRSIKETVLQLTAPEINAEGGTFFLSWSALAQELQKPVRVTGSSRGQILFFQADTTLSAAAIDTWKEILSYLQFTSPEKKGTQQWTAAENNSRGTYRAAYRVTGKEDSLVTIEKKIRQYTRVKKTFKNQQIIPETVAVFMTDAQGAPVRIAVSETETVMLGKDTISMRAAEVTIKRLGNSNQMPSALMPRKGLSRHTLDEDISEAQIAAMAYAHTLGADDWNSLLKKISLYDSITKPAQDSLTLSFRALFALHPQECVRAKQYLLQIPPASKAYLIVTRALSITPNAQAAAILAQLAWQKRNDLTHIMEILPVLSVNPYVSRQAVQQIWPLHLKKYISDEWLRSTATLTLAAMIHRLSATDPQNANSFARQLLAEQHIEKDTLNTIMVMGNIGLPLVYTSLEKVIAMPQASTTVKKTAIGALQLISDKRVEALLSKLLLSSDTALQTEARRVVQERQKSTAH